MIEQTSIIDLTGIFYCDYEYWDKELLMFRKCGKRAKYHAGRNMHVCEEHVQNPNAKIIEPQSKK